mmetsp:Transcript_110434/g.263243  ORF Transcript_110434/g.263243 Transcript_110434/m.263243 type:complete len:248 (-) Transcript_110434:1547-2290(-)
MPPERSSRPTASSTAERPKDGVRIVKGTSRGVGDCFRRPPCCSSKKTERCSGMKRRQDTPSARVTGTTRSFRSFTSRMRQGRLVNGMDEFLQTRLELFNAPVVKEGAFTCTSRCPFTVYQSQSSASVGSPYLPTQSFLKCGGSLSTLGYSGWSSGPAPTQRRLVPGSSSDSGSTSPPSPASSSNSSGSKPISAASVSLQISFRSSSPLALKSSPASTSASKASMTLVESWCFHESTSHLRASTVSLV